MVCAPRWWAVYLGCDSECLDIEDADGVSLTFTHLYPPKMIPRAGQSMLRQARSQLRQRSGPTSVASLSAFARLLSSLAILEQKDGKLNNASLGAVTAAQKLGGSVTGFVAGGNVKSVAEEAAKIKGLEKIVSVDNEAYDKACVKIALVAYRH